MSSSAAVRPRRQHVLVLTSRRLVLIAADDDNVKCRNVPRKHIRMC